MTQSQKNKLIYFLVCQFLLGPKLAYCQVVLFINSRNAFFSNFEANAERWTADTSNSSATVERWSPSNAL